jgi:adenylate cyclase
VALSNTQRKLTAILCADVVGYSRLMGADEEATIETLTAYRKVFLSHIESHRGRVVDAKGDAIMAEFASVVAAVNSALGIQRELSEKNASLPDERQMNFRIGVNLGDVVVQDDMIYGDGVNVAARLESLAEPGGVCISRPVYDQVEARIDLEWDYLGEQEVKNIAKPVRAYRIAPVRAGRSQMVDHTIPKSREGVESSAQLSSTEEGSPLALPRKLPLPPKPTLAVLPWTNISGAPDESYLVDGVVQDLIAALSRNRWLLVLAWGSTVAFREHGAQLGQLAEKIDADYLVTGSLQRDGSRLRINVQLIHGGSGAYLWVEKFDHDIAGIFELQDQIASSVAARVGLELRMAEQERVKRKPPQNLDAWDSYLLGLTELHTFTGGGFKAAQAYFSQATRLDPQFALAHASLAFCTLLSTVYFDVEPSGSLLDRTLASAERAVSLDDQDAMSRMVLGRAHLARGEYDDAVRQCEVAINLNPCLPVAHCVLADALTCSDRLDEGLKEFEVAIQLGTNDPWRWGMCSYRAMAHIFRGEYEIAAEWAGQATLIPNSHFWANAHLATALGHLDRAEQAGKAVDLLLKRKPDFSCEYPRRHLAHVRSAAQMDMLNSGLRKAGVPE